MTLLLLAGTGQALQIASALADCGTDAIASLAGVTRAPRMTDLSTRIGGFGGEDGFTEYLSDNQITAVLDATHPFANHISNRTARICKQKGLPYCQLLRPEWRPEAGDLWTFIDAEEGAANHIATGSTVFLATGRQTLGRFAKLAECQLICRQIDPPDRDFPFPNGKFLVGRPPFSTEEEISLFKKLKIDWLVVKNAGGNAPRTKLIAARELGIRVAMINRPQQPDAHRVDSVQDALDWVAML